MGGIVGDNSAVEIQLSSFVFLYPTYEAGRAWLPEGDV